MVEADADGNLLRGVKGVVPAGFPQSAVMGEHFGLVQTAAHQAHAGTNQLHVDCAALFKGIRSILEAKGPGSPLAGLWRWYQEMPRLDGAIKLKAHQELEGMEPRPQLSALLGEQIGRSAC